uniref:Vacuolar protein sorting-associated protein 8 central domain-containing protein n=1 Tax=Ditylenchus dipsaci TaxID=166011 RepID=A0A915EKH6_9BILA
MVRDVCHLQRFVNKEVLSDCEIVQGNKLLLYLNCCLAGRAYPFGYLPENLCELVPMETYKFLIQLRPKSASSLQSNAELASDCSFPNLRLLLKFDARQFLNVICTCGDAPLFANSDGRLKRLVDILVSQRIRMYASAFHNDPPAKIGHTQGYPFVYAADTIHLLRSVPEIDTTILQLALPLPYTHNLSPVAFTYSLSTRDHSPGSPTSSPGTLSTFLVDLPTLLARIPTILAHLPTLLLPTNSTGSPINFPGTPSYPPGIPNHSPDVLIQSPGIPSHSPTHSPTY